MKIGRTIAAGILLILPAALLTYGVRRSQGWRPNRASVERESLAAGSPGQADLEALCKQATIPVVGDLPADHCEGAQSALETALGPAVARTLVQACRDKHAIFARGVVHLPNPSLCRQSPLPPECRTVCGGQL
jgi:hypothetical protein